MPGAGRELALVGSMGAVSSRADYAACEGFLGMLKCERANQRSYRQYDETRADTFDYIERRCIPIQTAAHCDA